MSEYKEHRKFIHDVSNMLAIAEGSLKRVRKLEAKEDIEEYKLEIVENFDLSEKYMKECIKEYRVFIHQLEASSIK
jgi:uncharacterized membrane-anchored protein YhcB (DUF1043 family)